MLYLRENITVAFLLVFKNFNCEKKTLQLASHCCDTISPSSNFPQDMHVPIPERICQNRSLSDSEAMSSTSCSLHVTIDHETHCTPQVKLWKKSGDLEVSCSKIIFAWL